MLSNEQNIITSSADVIATKTKENNVKQATRMPPIYMIETRVVGWRTSKQSLLCIWWFYTLKSGCPRPKHCKLFICSVPFGWESCAWFDPNCMCNERKYREKYALSDRLLGLNLHGLCVHCEYEKVPVRFGSAINVWKVIGMLRSIMTDIITQKLSKLMMGNQ